MKGRKINGAARPVDSGGRSSNANGAEVASPPAAPQTEEGIRRGLAACRAVLARREPGSD